MTWDQSLHYLIEQAVEVVKLSTTHSIFQDQDLRAGISKVWPEALARLKNYLETGQALPAESWDTAVH